MTTKSLSILIALTVIIAAIATVVVVRNRAAVTADRQPQHLFPSLAARVNDVAGIRLQQGTESLTITRSGEQWLVEKLGGYPAKFESVKELIVAMSDLKAIEPRTRTPGLYPRLGVEDPGTGAASTLLTLTDATGAELASLIVGNPGPPEIGAATTLFVRKPGDPQSWLARGRLTSTTDAMSWVSRDVFSLDNTRVQSVTITHPDGEQVVITRAASEVVNFSLADLPAGRTIRSPGTVNGIGQALGFVSADNIRTAAEFEWEAEDVVIAEYRTFDGLLITIRSLAIDDTHWINISVSTTAPMEGAELGGRDVVAEAEELNRKLSGWAFAVSSFKADQMRRRLEDLLLPPPEATPEAAPSDPWSENVQIPSLFGPLGAGGGGGG